MGYYGYSSTINISIREEKPTEAGRVVQLNQRFEDLVKEFEDLRLLIRPIDADVVDSVVDDWHHSDGLDQQLHEYMGLTWDEYRRWVERPV